MFHKIDNPFHELFLGIVLLYSLFALAQSSNECGTCIENEKLTYLIEKFDMLQAEMKSKNVELKSENKKFKAQLNQLKYENEELKSQLSQQGEKILLLKKEMFKKKKTFGPPNMPTDWYTKKVDTAASNKNEKRPSRDLALLPTSCEGLRKEGHFSNGIYLVLNEKTNKIDAAFCQFSGANQVVQERVGTVEVKTSTVHFYVQRNSDFGPGSGLVPFDLAIINEGNGFDLSSGIFTVPVSGIYHFDFSAVKSYTATYLGIYLQVNGVEVAGAGTQQSNTGSFDVVSLSASFRLAKGDRVNLYNYYSGVLVDTSDHYTHFSGWLVEEDLV